MANNKDVGLEVSLNGEDRTLTRYNTTLFSFWGRVVLRGFELDATNFNHIFIQTSDTEGSSVQGAFLFNNHPVYKKIADFAIKHDFPAVLNRTEIPECDVRAFENTMFGDLTKTDGVPKEWK